jgi:hypothetical protein
VPCESQLSQDPDRLLECLAGRTDPRIFRAFAVACCRRLGDRLDAAARHAVEVAAEFADGRATPADLDAARATLGSLVAAEAAQAAWYCVWRDPAIAARNAAWYAAAATVGRRAPHAVWTAERAAQAALLRQLVGDPFALG